MSSRVDYEAELAVVIGKVVRNITPEEAREGIFGYSCFNDVTARDLQQKDVQWTRAKSFDTFGPFGPWIEMDIDPSNLGVAMIHNEKVVQNGLTSDMIFDIPYIVSYLSRIMTLNPGDIIATGTPSGIGPVENGDILKVRIQGIGELENRVKRP
jgi:2-keto-4-pentenoate hydratase/2-oxohepta-3-ene-1,7-dioic acid hydratase in catechol pathway